MIRLIHAARWPFLGALAAALIAIPSAPAVAQPPAIPPAAESKAEPVKKDREKEIAEVERQIAELRRRLEELRRPQAPMPRAKSGADASGAIPDDYIKKMTWRPIGPASMGGRITAIAAVESDPATYFIATASGGLLKTTNNGTTFDHLFDKQGTVSLGDVAVAPSDPKIVWVGTGENNPRNSVSYGDGVYKSTDGGKTWTHMGLRESFQIGKIVIHPTDPNTVYVGALGRLYGANPQRGLFKTTDGGQTWKKVLFVDDRTGVIDFRIDPFDPETLIVGMWERQRDEFDGHFGPSTSWPSPDQYGPAVTYGPGGGLFKTSDGGETWKKLTAGKTGLPTVKTGRIGIDYSRKTKGLVYAIIDTENVGKGRPVLSVYVGLSTETEKGGGIRVTFAPEDAPAGKAGIKEDDVIIAIDGKTIANYDDFNAYLVTKKPGEVIKVTVKRDGKEQVIEVKLGEREPKEKKKEGPPPPVLGIFLEDAVGGVRVERVTDDGPADQAGIQAEDLITAIGGKKVTDQETFRTIIATLKAGQKVKVTVVRDKKPRDIEVTLAAGQSRKGGARRPSNPLRPFLMSGVVGGQQQNVQNQQGKDGYQTGGVYLSRDNGETWTRVNSLNPRPFYYCNIRVDPTNDRRLYVLGDTTLWTSTNGGDKFVSAPTRGVHPDHHALWIDPANSEHMLIGCDGGFYVTYDRGQNWDHLNTTDLGQFYHVAVDNKTPYNVYGGLQDNGCWGGPSHVLRSRGPVNEDWIFLNGGDGFVCRVDPTDPDLVYFESQNGVMGRRNLRTGERAGFGPRPIKKGEQLRFNWNTPFILSNHNASIVYCAAQYVFRSVEKGDNMKVISPEITRTKKGSGTAVAESPLNPDVLWAGTDDGNVWITRDGGQKWDNVYDKLEAAGLPGPRWVASIEPSRDKEGRCYVALDAHRSDDDQPYLFVTEDYGQTWRPITANLPEFGSTRVLREDYTDPDILYTGTEFGIFVSLNRGGSWARLNNNLPTVAVHEVAQPTTANEIVVATHGRSLWVLDVNSLRQMSPRTAKNDKDKKGRVINPLKDPVTLFTPATAIRWKLQVGTESPYSMSVRKFYGTNPDRRAAIEYILTKPAKEVSLKIVDITGTPVREFRSPPKEAGFHRQQWDLTRTGTGSRTLAPAGTYRVVLTVDGKEYGKPITLMNDPNADPKAIITAEEEIRGEEEEEGEMEEEM